MLDPVLCMKLGDAGKIFPKGVKRLHWLVNLPIALPEFCIIDQFIL